MHMADALISPAVGGTLWAVSGGLIAFCARQVKKTLRDDLIPMMGVLGAFIFAAQMINFSIPGTGSSGHLGGGLMLAILLGPWAAFLVIASVLSVQALFFADGGLLALGCNIFNMGFFPAFIAYPCIYRVIAKDRQDTLRIWTASILASVASLQLGAFGVVLQTSLSGISELPFGTFSLMMLPIHLAIGLVEGLATAAVVSFMCRVRPEALATTKTGAQTVGGIRRVVAGALIAAACLGGIASWFASTQPDGLEWSIAKVAGTDDIPGSETSISENLGKLQEKTAFLPDYGFKEPEAEPSSESGPWPAISAGTSVSGIVGGLVTLAISCLIGLALKLCVRPNTRPETI